MLTLSHRGNVAVSVAASLTTTFGFVAMGHRLFSKVFDRFTSRSRDAHVIMEQMVIKVAHTEKQCSEVVSAILLDLKEDRVVGFDCEWVQKDRRRPVALLQLASPSGLCGLFQLCLLPEFPSSLKSLLEDRHILKVGLDPLSDSNYLCADYGITVAGTLDLRHLSSAFPKMSLASIVERELNISLPKSKSIRTSNWEKNDLSPDQIQYAAMDALSSVLTFNKLIHQKVDIPFFASKEHACNLIYEFCVPLMDTRFREKSYPKADKQPSSRTHPLQRHESGLPKGTVPNENGKGSFRAFSVRKTPLYENCLLIAPDGEVLCTCDAKKADWYISKGIATLESVTPYKVRLLFEPSGRSSGNSGQYYIQEKENQCVVCGRKDSYVRKKIVPHEYRKYFPVTMKNHQSHDVLLLCIPCHIKSNSEDMSLRSSLGRMCSAPLDSEENMKVTEDRKCKQLRSAARALLQAENLPEERKEELTNIILDCYPKITPHLLNELKNLDINIFNSDYSPHGLSVVEYFAKDGADGLRNFEKLWRQHFLQTMKPRFLPLFWSVDHCHEDESRYHVDTSHLWEQEVCTNTN